MELKMQQQTIKKGKAVVEIEEGKVETEELIKAVEKAGFSASES